MGLRVQHSSRRFSLEEGVGLPDYLRRVVVLGLTVMLILGSVVIESPPARAAASLEEYLGTVTTLCPNPSWGLPGRVKFTVERCLYIPASDYERFA